MIIEDDEDLRIQMKWALAQDYEVLLADDKKSAIAVLRREHPAVITLDLGLPPLPVGVEEGFAVLEDILTEDGQAKVIIITGRGERENAIRAVEKGAYDFFYKPIQLDELNVILRRAFHLYELEQEQRALQQQFAGETFQGMLGTSRKMQEVFSAIRKVSTTDVPILVMGESGTGKELVARAIHQLGFRQARPFIEINCGAIPENLLESELFGHEKGAFTGAHIQRKGRFEMAEGGTIFLDEIGELSLPLQVKLLRFLQEKIVERVGGRERIEVNARIIAATNRDLKEAVKGGNFRDDLYFRLGVILLTLPPLREREGDVILLAKAFMQRYSSENRKKISGFTNQAIMAIEQHNWPGNVRELENRIKRAVIMTDGSKIIPADLELDEIVTNAKYETMKLKDARENLEKELLEKALTHNNGNMTKAASELGISRPTLYDLMEKFQHNR